MEALELDDMQGLLVRGYGMLPSATYLALAVADAAAARRWLSSAAATVTTGTGRPTDAARNIALSARGLRRLGLDPTALGQFPLPFTEGMAVPHRSRLLGDVGDQAPDRWDWGGPDREVDVLLMMYGRDPASLAAAVEATSGDLAAAGLQEVVRLQSDELGETEHFGFRDGLSQPTLAGLPTRAPATETVEDGEFVLGYRNEYDRYTDRPLVHPDADPRRLLPDDVAGSGLRDLGRNGSYLVVRQLAQDVRGFWAFLRSVEPDDRAARVRLAAKMVGRWPSGASLVLAPDGEDPALATSNDFGYHRTDAAGTLCPIGAHVRRAHPRDSLDPRPGSQASIDVGKRHRLLRRGRPYGRFLPLEQLVDDPDGVDDEPRGLHFACLNANLARQFEFVQSTWLQSPKFAGLFDDPDPLLGDGSGTFTQQARPVRRRVTSVPRFVGVRGGGYFFLPGVRALRYLAQEQA